MLVVCYIGFGNSVNRYHLPYVLKRRKDKVKVKYIFRRECDRVGDTDRELWYPDITFTTDFNQVLNDPEVNLIVVNTPDEFHEEYTRMAIAAGKNCLCEKPFSRSSKEAREILELAKEKGVVVTANQNRRFDADMRTVRKVIQSGVLGEILEIESHYDYYRPQIKHNTHLGLLFGLQIHPLDQIIGEFGFPDHIVYDVRSYDNPGRCDDYSDIDLFYGKMKAIVKTSYYVKIEYPRFIVHGTKGSFIMPQLGHQSALGNKPGPVEISFDSLPEEFWGTLCYIDDDGNEINEKVPVEIQDYGMVYDNLYDVIINGKEKVIKDEEIIRVLEICEAGVEAAKQVKY